jgi:hypothetical protein
MNGLSEYYDSNNKGNNKLGLVSAQIYFNALKQFSLDQLMEAASLHLQNAENGQFYPKVADFTRYLLKSCDVSSIKPDEVIAMACEPVTPLGVLARIKIGTCTLFTETDPFIRRQSAMMFIQSLPSTYRRAKDGGYTAHEIATMQKLSVSPNAPVYHNDEKPCLESIERIKLTYHENKNESNYLVWSGAIDDQEYIESISNFPALPKPTDDEIAEVKSMYEGLGNGNGFDFEKADLIED